MDKILENFSKLIEKNNPDELAKIIANQNFENYPLLEKIITKPKYLEKAIDIVINKNDELFYSLLKELVSAYFQISPKKALEFSFKKLDEIDIDENRYERIIFESEIFFPTGTHIEPPKDNEDPIIEIYNTLQNFVQEDPMYVLEEVEKLLEKYPEEDLLYYLYADVAFNLFRNSDFEDENEKQLIKSLFEKFFNWFVKRMKKDLSVEKLNANWIYYSCIYAEILLAEEGEESKAGFILQFLALNMDKIIESELEMVEDTETIKIIILQYFEYFVYVTAAFYSLLYKENIDKILYEFDKFIDNPNKNLVFEGYPLLTISLRTIYKFPFLTYFNPEDAKESAYFDINGK